MTHTETWTMEEVDGPGSARYLCFKGDRLARLYIGDSRTADLLHRLNLHDELVEAANKECAWNPVAGTMIADQPQWQTECGNTVVAISDENYRYCPFCRGRIAARSVLAKEDAR